MPVPGWAAGVPQAATISARATDMMRDAIDNLEDYDAGAVKKFRPVSRPAVPRSDSPARPPTAGPPGLPPVIRRRGRPRRAFQGPIEEDSDGGQRHVDAAVTGVWTILRAGPERRVRLPAASCRPSPFFVNH